MCNSLEERSSPLRSAALHLSTLAEIVIRCVLNAAFPRINLRPVAAFCIISQSNHVHNRILQRSSLQSLYIFQNVFFFSLSNRSSAIYLHPSSQKKKKRNLVIIYSFLSSFKYPRSTKTIYLDTSYIFFVFSVWKNGLLEG